VEVMTDKATVTIPSPRKGRVLRLLFEEGAIARVHDPLMEIEVEGGDPVPRVEEVAPPAARAAPVTAETRAAVAASVHLPVPEPARNRKALATPAVRALARELGLDVHQVAGSGPDGRITKDDLRAHGARNGKAGGRAVEEPAAPDPAGRNMELVPVRGLRRRIAEKMARSKRTAAHFTFVEEVDVTELVRVKERMARAAVEDGAKVTFLPFVLKAVVTALKRFPELNATFDEERGEIQLKRWYDLGVAAATEQGLVVPVVRRADQRSILELARELARLAADARAGKLRPEDVGNSTFTVTSLGAQGGLFATPVINVPEVAIHGVHRIRPTPVVRDGQVVVRDVMHLSLSSDHRVVDGHRAAAFVYEVIRYLEEPSLLFLQMI
jgi:pyruvate dehydrogenase E2 component (dihydrolipoamide acetyltransferase)